MSETTANPKSLRWQRVRVRLYYVEISLAELCQAQVKLEGIVKVIVEVGFEIAAIVEVEAYVHY